MANLQWLDRTDPAVVHIWEKTLDREFRSKGPLFNEKFGFSGDSKSKLIHIKDDLAVGRGATITSKIRWRLGGKGRAGDEPLKGNTEGYQTSTQKTQVDIVRHGVGVDTPMHQQFVREDVLEESADALAEWGRERFEFVANLHATGFHIITDAVYTFHNTIEDLSSRYIIRPGGVTDAESLVSTNIFDVDFLNDLSRRLKLLRPRLEPVSTPVGDKFVVFLAPEQVHQLYKSDETWFQMMQQMLSSKHGIENNPLLSNALGMHREFVFFESTWVPPGIHSTQDAIVDKTRRGWVGGAQALSLAFGRGDAPKGFGLNRWQWDYETEDFGHQKQIAATTIVGMDRPRYQHPDLSYVSERGVLGFETYADYGAGLTSSDVYAEWLNAGATMAT